MNKVFVVFSHSGLTKEQIDTLPNFIGSEEFEIAYLSNVDSFLQNQFSKLSPAYEVEDIFNLAKKIVSCAVKNNATHIFCVGEPLITSYVNLVASGKFSFNGIKMNGGRELITLRSVTDRVSVEKVLADGTVEKTSVFKHIRWTNFF